MTQCQETVTLEGVTHQCRYDDDVPDEAHPEPYKHHNAGKTVVWWTEAP